jgi:Predicted transcriptional regulators
MDGLTIGDVARQAHIHIETLRYYERRGLVARPPRSISNYRLYSEDTVRRLRFIKHAQALGFSLKEIRELLSLRAAPRARYADIRQRAEAKIKDVEEKNSFAPGDEKKRSRSLSLNARDMVPSPTARSLSPLIARTKSDIEQVTIPSRKRSDHEYET